MTRVGKVVVLLVFVTVTSAAADDDKWSWSNKDKREDTEDRLGRRRFERLEDLE